MDNQITIDNTNSQETENQVLKLYFEPRKWSFNKACEHNVGNRSFITGPDGVFAEGFIIGDWNWTNWTEIVSGTLLLPKNRDCSFTFWLNGGENDSYSEVCRLEILFNNDYEQRLTYNLNRNFIRPVKKLNGWELYEIPFRTQDNEYTELRFVAHKAYLTILTAKDASAYADLPDTVDPFEEERPQRHNIIFGDGFPAFNPKAANYWYSTKFLQEAHEKKQAAGGIPSVSFSTGEDLSDMAKSLGFPNFFQPDGQYASKEFSANIDTSQIPATLEDYYEKMAQEKYSSVENLVNAMERSSQQVRGTMEGAIQGLNTALQQLTDELKAGVTARLNAISANLNTLSSTCDMLENFDMESLADNVNSGSEESSEELEDALSDAADSMSEIADELRDSIEEVADRLEEIRESLSM